MRITREELYKEIWSEPATKLAQRYDVSSSYVARVCEGLNVPHPTRGYWARKAAGEKMPVPPLPRAGPGDPLSWEKGVAVMERLPPLELPPPEAKSRGKAAPPKAANRPTSNMPLWSPSGEWILMELRDGGADVQYSGSWRD